MPKSATSVEGLANRAIVTVLRRVSRRTFVESGTLVVLMIAELLGVLGLCFGGQVLHRHLQGCCFFAD
jgi:hypothetical protein